MKKLFLKSGLIVSLAISLFYSCANDDKYSTPENTLVTYELTVTRTVLSVRDAVKSTTIPPAQNTTPVAFVGSDIIEAYVTSSDEKGTFYKSISFQTIPKDGSAPIGFSVPLNATTLYGKGFTPGRKVFIKLEGLYSAIVFGSLQIGSLYEGTIGRISEFEWQDHLFPSAKIVSESEMVRTLSLANAYTDDNQNTLVELDAVQFSESSINRTYYDIDSGGGATNHKLISSVGGIEQIIRFSSFCPFTGNQIPKLSGKIRGVLTKYDKDFQFIVRYETDIKLTLPRFDVSPALGGTAIVYSGVFTENFESYTAGNASTGTKVFPKYINDADKGSKYWFVESFSSNKYLKMSSFSTNPTGQEQNNNVYFIVPVNFTAANKMSFKTQDRFNDSDVLKIYLSTNYIPNGNINAASLNDITNNFIIASGTTGSASQPFVNSGLFNFPATLTGNGFIIFEYKGGYSTSPAKTTTMHIDDIIVN